MFIKRIVICGSISFYPEFVKIQRALGEARISSVIPSNDDEVKHKMSEAMFQDYKRKASFEHIKRIRDPRTVAILAVNIDKHNIHSYIGPNTFAEIAIAFAQSKKIYLLMEMPEIYKDELTAWRTIPLHGDLYQLINDFDRSQMGQGIQLELFTDILSEEL